MLDTSFCGQTYCVHSIIRRLLTFSYNCVDSFTWLQRIKVIIGFACLLDSIREKDPPNLPYRIHNIDAQHIMLDQVFICVFYLLDVYICITLHNIQLLELLLICRIAIRNYSTSVASPVEFFLIRDHNLLRELLVILVCFISLKVRQGNFIR